MLLAPWLHFPMCSDLHSINPSHHHQTFRSVFCPCHFYFPSTSYLALCMWTTCTTFLSLHPQRRPIASSFLSSSFLPFPFPLVSCQNLMQPSSETLYSLALWPGQFQRQAIWLQTWWASLSCFHKSLTHTKFSQENQHFRTLALSSLTRHV